MTNKTKKPSTKTLKEIKDNGVALKNDSLNVAIKKLDSDGKNPLIGLDGQIMVVSAHRYCLGRQTYVVGSCIDWMIKWWPQFERNTRRVIVKDTVQAIQEDSAGSKYDTADWLRFAVWAYDALELEDKKWVKSSLDYNNKPWPLNNK